MTRWGHSTILSFLYSACRGFACNRPRGLGSKSTLRGRIRSRSRHPGRFGRRSRPPTGILTFRLGVVGRVPLAARVRGPAEGHGTHPDRGSVRRARVDHRRECATAAAGHVALGARGYRGRGGFTVEANYELTINRRSLEPGEPAQPVPQLARAARSAFLAPSNHFDFTSPRFRAWLRKEDLKRRPEERDLDFAYRAMGTMVRTHTYRFELLVRPLGIGCL